MQIKTTGCYDEHMTAEKNNLSESAYRVTQKGATEPPFSGQLLKEDRDGTYHCVVCDAPLFSSETKFDSGSGWPSFTAAVDEEHVALSKDTSLGMERTEVICASCGAHLGHVFPDGPSEHPDGSAADGNRFCINSCALDFASDETSSSPES